jgi:DNA repair exonuclease SbcCD ATPase subunit
MKKILGFILSLISAWRKHEQEQGAEQLQVEQKGEKAILAIKETIESPVSDPSKRIKKLEKRGKDLGLVIALMVLLPVSGLAQTAEQRIQTYSLEDLKTYTQQLVELARDQQAMIAELRKQNEDYINRLKTIDKQLDEVNTSLKKLSPVPHGFAKILDILIKAAPIALAGVAAVK